MITAVKKKIEEKMNAGNSININLLLSIVDNYEYISFDIFDTLIKRNVHKPTSVFCIMEKKLEGKYDCFYEKRVLAEKKARENTYKEEITIEDIYNNYKEIDESEREYLIELELEIEKNVLMVNLDIIELYYKCVNEGKKVFLISDMYLPVDFIKEVLSKNGITGYTELYLSSDKMKTKATGNLFKLLLDEQAITPNRLMHIGDSWRGDYNAPLKLGVVPYHIPRDVSRSSYKIDSSFSDIRIEYLNSFINNNVKIKRNSYYKFGYEKFGMFLWGYAKWLLEEAAQKNIKKMYFFSRDGLIIKKAVDICNRDSGVKTYYLEVSRRSLRVPVLWMDCDFETVINMLSPSKIISINMIFDGIGLDILQYDKILKKHSFTRATTFDRSNILCNKALQEMYNELKPDIIEVSKKEYNLLKQYIIQNDLSGEFTIIDIGWSGGMQRYLDQTLTKMGVSHRIYGYYIGVAEYFKRNTIAVKDLDLNGYLFDFKNNINAVDKRSCFVGLFETLFLEQGGSVRNYCTNESGIVHACRYPYEYIQNGKPTEEYLYVQNIQEGALQFIYEIMSDVLINSFRYKADELFSGLYQTGARPNKEDIKLFADFNFYDEGEMGKLAAPNSLLFYLFNLKTFKRDFLSSRWKVGFMKRLFKANLQYEKIYKWMLALK